MCVQLMRCSTWFWDYNKNKSATKNKPTKVQSNVVETPKQNKSAHPNYDRCQCPLMDAFDNKLLTINPHIYMAAYEAHVENVFSQIYK